MIFLPNQFIAITNSYQRTESIKYYIVHKELQDEAHDRF